MVLTGPHQATAIQAAGVADPVAPPDAPWANGAYAGHSSGAATNPVLPRTLVASAATNLPKCIPVNLCSYHLQEAAGTPVQEVGYALATAVAVLAAVQARSALPIGDVVSRMSFFVNAGVRFVEEMAKMRA